MFSKKIENIEMKRNIVCGHLFNRQPNARHACFTDSYILWKKKNNHLSLT